MEGKNRLPISAIDVWRMHGLIELLIFGLLLCIELVASLIWDWPIWIFWLLLIIFILYIPLCYLFFPKLRWKQFFYEIKNDEIDIQDGVLIIKHTLIPIVKIQKIYISQGPILKKLDLANVTINTAASEETIPALPYKTAQGIRKYISQLVTAADENE